MLITARALQGVGGGGIQSLIFILVSEVVTMRERGKYQSLMMSLAGTAMVIGPIVGGAFTEHLSWVRLHAARISRYFMADLRLTNSHSFSSFQRWCFWINVPLVGLSAIGQQFTLIPTGNRSSMRQKLARVDWIGAGLCIAGACLVLLGFTWSTDGWTTGKCLGGLISGAAILALFMVWEAYGAKEPAVPVWLFKSRTFVLACIIQVSLGWSMMASFDSQAGRRTLGIEGLTFSLFSSKQGLAYFVPQYWQLTRGADAMSSSLMFLPFGVMWFLGSIVVGIASAKTGRYVEFPKIGFLVCTAMIAVMTACFTVDFNYYAAYTIEAILGLFLAVAMTLMMLIVQVGVDPRDLGPATAVGYFMRNLGSTMSIAVASSVVITVTTTNYTNMVPGFMAAGISPLAAKEYIMSMTSGTAPPTGLTQAQIELLAAGAAQAFDVGLRWVFGAQVPACFIAWIASLFLKHKPLSNKATGFQTRQAGDKTVHTIEDDKTTTVEIEDDDSKKNSQDKTHEEHKA